ncbi:radical SAM/SPASM domain-containing protein [Streptomyces ureilyticus]|uniref:radical SAM/SPASM domain-containing protein n=1 Tax=Streptomyces ureilyticus TaxID=1775131 RepID=UPI002E2B89E0|nr:radical SAM protein [Streptomyces ureilyticus]
MSDAEDKVSEYRIVSKSCFRNRRGQPVKLIYATRTSEVFPVPLAIAQALDRGEAGSVLTEQERTSLRRREILVPADENELDAVTGRLQQGADDVGHRHLALLPTSYCNMGCTYCGQTHRRIPLRGQHRDAVRRRVLGVLNREDTRSARVDWFGGEPLMAYAIIRDLAASFLPVVERRGLGWSSVIVTNGALLSYRKIKVLAKECRVTHAEITIDGPPDVHDVHRPLKSGMTSFWRIVESLQQALDDDETAGMTFGIRTNVDVHNEDRVEEMLQMLAAEGFTHPRVRFGIKPVHSWGNDVRELELAKQHFADREARWLSVMRSLGLNFQVLPTAPARKLCPAVSRSDELITPDGDAFSCSEQPLVDHLKSTAVGNVDQDWAASGGLRPTGTYDDWHTEVAAPGSQRSCTTCRFYPTCGGACPKLWREGHWPCPSYKFNIQARFDLIAEMNGFTKIEEG